MEKETSGLAALNAKYTKHLETLELISGGATNVIPLVTGHESEEALAWTVEATRYFRRGLITQIYMFWEISPSTLGTAISSNLKATGQRLKGRFSEVSRNNASTKVLVLGSSSSQEQSSEDQS